MTLDDFDQTMMTKFEEFKKYWLEHDDWPDKMEEEEWIEQFIAFLQEEDYLIRTGYLS